MMMDPKKLLDRLPRFDKDRPFRFLGRRVVQAMVDAATANLILGQRTAPGSYLVVRLVESGGERDHWEQLFAESRGAILQEIEREAAARDVKTRSSISVDLAVLTEEQASRGEARRVLASVADGPALEELERQLQEAREVILPRRTRTLMLESDPPEAQVYLDHRPVGVTPCRVEDIAQGEHSITFSKRGYLLYEDTFTVEPGAPGERLRYEAFLEPEPNMAVLEVQTFPPRARVTVKGEMRPAPAQWRLPAGEYGVEVALPEFAPASFRVNLPNTGDERPFPVSVRLVYNGADRDEVVGRLIVYKPEPGTPSAREDPEASRIRDFFQQADPADDEVWDAPMSQPAPLVVLGERPLRRGVLLIGREDPGAEIRPDVRLFDPENSVSRGCHAWLWIYADRSTGAAYNTFLIGNNSPAGVRVDGQLVTETRRLSDDSLIEIGNFKLRVVKESPQARVEF